MVTGGAFIFDDNCFRRFFTHSDASTVRELIGIGGVFIQRGRRGRNVFVLSDIRDLVDNDGVCGGRAMLCSVTSGASPICFTKGGRKGLTCVRTRKCRTNATRVASKDTVLVSSHPYLATRLTTVRGDITRCMHRFSCGCRAGSQSGADVNYSGCCDIRFSRATSAASNCSNVGHCDGRIFDDTTRCDVPSSRALILLTQSGGQSEVIIFGVAGSSSINGQVMSINHLTSFSVHPGLSKGKRCATSRLCSMAVRW